MASRQTTTSGMEWNTMLGLTDRLKRDGHTRNYLMILVGCYFGLRIGDLLSIRWADVIDKDELVIRESKSKKFRTITINDKVKEALAHAEGRLRAKDRFRKEQVLFANRWGEPLSISYINKRLKFLFARYNMRVQNASSHTLRKTFGKRVYEMDGQSERALIYLSDIFGHSSTSITRRYIGITQEQIADVYLKL